MDKRKAYLEGAFMSSIKVVASICGAILSIGSAVVAARKAKLYYSEYKKL